MANPTWTIEAPPIECSLRVVEVDKRASYMHEPTAEDWPHIYSLACAAIGVDTPPAQEPVLELIEAQRDTALRVAAEATAQSHAAAVEAQRKVEELQADLTGTLLELESTRTDLGEHTARCVELQADKDELIKTRNDLSAQLAARPVAVPCECGDHCPCDCDCWCHPINGAVRACNGVKVSPLPYAIPPAVQAVVDAAANWWITYGGNRHADHICDEVRRALCESLESLAQAAPYRCVRGWAFQAALIDPKFHSIHVYRAGDFDLVPVTLCYAPKGGEK